MLDTTEPNILHYSVARTPQVVDSSGITTSLPVQERGRDDAAASVFEAGYAAGVV